MDRLWWVFLVSSICTPFVVAIVVLAARISAYVGFKRKNEDVIDTQLNLKRELRYGPKRKSMTCLFVVFLPYPYASI